MKQHYHASQLPSSASCLCILHIFPVISTWPATVLLASSALHPLLSIGLFLFLSVKFCIMHYFYVSYFLTAIVCPTAAASSALHFTYSTPDTLSYIHQSSSLPLPHPCSQTLLYTSQLLPISLTFPRQPASSIEKIMGHSNYFSRDFLTSLYKVSCGEYWPTCLTNPCKAQGYSAVGVLTPRFWKHVKFKTSFIRHVVWSE